MSGPGYRTPAEREYDRLEQELSECETDEQRRQVRDAMRDMEREESERENWEREGSERGWY